MKQNVLVIAAHADDEAIGCGGTILRHKDQDDNVVVILCTKPGELRKAENELLKAVDESRTEYGIDYRLLGYMDQGLDTVPTLLLTKAIEQIVDEVKPDIVYTHSVKDLNQDHIAVYNAAVVACRFVKKLLFFHIPSPGELATFTGNYFNQIAWTPKESFLRTYHYEMRDTPHPRSYENIKAKAQVEGSKAGFLFAESFEVGRWTNEFISSW